MPRIWKFLIGYVTIQFEGLCLETFLNEISGSYKIRKIIRLRHTILRLTVSARKAEKICAAAEDIGLRWSIVGKDRQIRIAEMLWKRWWIPVFTAVMLIAAFWLSGCCFSIEFVGNEALSEFELSELLEQHGIAPGMRKSSIDLLALKNLLYREYRSLAYAEARFDGTALQIILQEGNEIPEILSADPCTIAAEKRGVILSVTVGEGMCEVAPGDLVDAGTPLISGAYQKKDIDFLVHARGKVLAQVDYFGKADLSLTSGLVRTGQSAKARYLNIGRMSIPLSGNNPYELYETESRTEYIISENMPAYLKVTETTYYQCERGISRELRTAAEIQLREQAYFNALSQVPDDAKIKDFYSVITEQDGKLSATATVTVVEDIGAEIPAIPENTEKTGDTELGAH